MGAKETRERLKKEEAAFIANYQAGFDNAASIITASGQKAADIMNEIVEDNIQYLTQQNQIADSFFAPFSKAGEAGLNKVQDLVGLNGDAALKAASDQVLQGADVQAAIKQGVDAAESSAAAGSQGIRSGRLFEQLQQHGQDTSFGALNQRRQDLFKIVDTGIQASTARANLAQQLGSDVSNQRLIGGEANANAEIASGNARATAASAVSTLAASMAGSHKNLAGGGGVSGAIAGGGSTYGNQGFFFGGDGGPRMDNQGRPLSVVGSQIVPYGTTPTQGGTTTGGIF